MCQDHDVVMTDEVRPIASLCRDKYYPGDGTTVYLPVDNSQLRDKGAICKYLVDGTQ